MRWADWSPLYDAIRLEFGYDKRDDEAARDELRELCVERFDLKRRDAFRKSIIGQEVWVAGPALGAEDLARIPHAAPLLVSDGAAGLVLPRRAATAIVTDLDGDVEAQLRANAEGTPMFVHAHGDNRDAIRRDVPRMTGPVFPTTQAGPLPPAFNHGGFTDGDRACCIAEAFGAASLVLLGFDFDRPTPKLGADPEVKRRKLLWARRIVDGLPIPVRHEVSSSTQA